MRFLKKLMNGKALMGICCVLAFMEAAPAQAQFVLPKRNINSAEPLSAKERWAFKTNALGWILMTPNASLEYDLSASAYNKLSLVGTGRFTWSSNPSVPSYHQFKTAGARLELRSYYHNRSRDRQNKYSNIGDYAFSHERYDARTWRGYFFGLYAGYDRARIKFSHEGFAGNIYQAGLSYGFVRPIYNYANSVLDLEFSANVGAAYVDGNKYVLNDQKNAYQNTTAKKGFLPYPVISDISVSLVYRFGPSEKTRHRFNQAEYLKKQEAKVERRKAVEAARAERANEIAAKRAAAAEAKVAKTDAEAKAAAKAAKEAAKAEKKAAKEAAKAAKKAEKALND